MGTKKRIFPGVYGTLLDALGPSHWWPAETPFEVMAGAVLTQNTSWRNVEKALAVLRERGLLDPRRLAALEPAETAPLIRSSGYYNQKAARLAAVTQWFAGHGFDPARARAVGKDRLRVELLAINGVGPETADSILCYALDLPVFVVDAYTFRWLSRWTGRPAPGYEELRAAVEGEFAGAFPAGELARHFNEFHALIVRLGHGFCRKRNPLCETCPLRRSCKELVGPDSGE